MGYYTNDFENGRDFFGRRISRADTLREIRKMHTETVRGARRIGWTLFGGIIALATGALGHEPQVFAMWIGWSFAAFCVFTSSSRSNTLAREIDVELEEIALEEDLGVSRSPTIGFAWTAGARAAGSWVPTAVSIPTLNEVRRQLGLAPVMEQSP